MTTLTLNKTLTAHLVSSTEDDVFARQSLVSARKRTHSVQEAERLDIALKQVCGERAADADDDFGIRDRLFATLERYGQASAKPAGVAQWHIELRQVLTCEAEFLKAHVVLEAFWCEPLAAEAGLDVELAAAMGERIAQEVARHFEAQRHEFPETIALWTLDVAPAALHAAESLKAEVGVALMNELYGAYLEPVQLAA